MIETTMPNDDWRYELFAVLDKFPRVKNAVITGEEVVELVEILKGKMVSNRDRRGTKFEIEEAGTLLDSLCDNIEFFAGRFKKW